MEHLRTVAVLQARVRKEDSMKAKLILALLWVVGGVLTALSAILFTGVISPWKDESAGTPLAYEENVQTSRPRAEDRSVTDSQVRAYGANGEESVPVQEKRVPDTAAPEHVEEYAPTARDPRDASYALPSAMAELPAQLPPPEESPTDISPADYSISSGFEEHVTVAGAVNIRAEPSRSGDLIGVVRPGAELLVVERRSGWVKFFDPASAKTGWVYEEVATKSDSEKPVQKASAVKAKPVPPTAKKRAPTSNERQAGLNNPRSSYRLPAEGEIQVVPRRRFGFFGRRRALQEQMITGELQTE